MQKSKQSGGPPRGRKTARRGAGGTHVAGSSRVGSPDWALEQQQNAGNQTVLGMIGGTRDTQEIAGDRPVGRMVEWTPQRGGEMKCRALFPPGTVVNMGDVGTIADRWGYRVERWEVINDNVHIEFVTMAPHDQFAWGNEVILGAAPPETVLEQVQDNEAEGKGMLAAASGMVAAAMLSPAAPQAGATPGVTPTMGMPGAQQQGALPGMAGLGPAAPGAAGSTGLAASMVAAALCTQGPGATQAATPGVAPAGPAMGMPGMVAPATGAATTTQKLGVMETLLGTGTQQAPQASPDQQIQQSVQAFTREAGRSSPDMSTLQRIATSVQGERLFELLGRDLSERQVENVVRAAKDSSAGQSLLTLLEDRLYPSLSSGAQGAWDAVMDEDLVEQAKRD
jgi:hypothetical protein